MLSRRALPLRQPFRSVPCNGPITIIKPPSVRHTVPTHSLRIGFSEFAAAPYARQQIARLSTVRSAPRLGRLFRTSLLAAITLAVGAAAGAAVGWGCNTWLYMRWGEETAKHGRNVATRPELDVSFFSQNATGEEGTLRRGWQEVKPDDSRKDRDENKIEGKNVYGKHLTYETLSVDKQELITRGYVNVERPATLFVFMADYGVEGWPRVVHGGITTSLIYDALKLHAKHYPDQVMSDNVQVDLNYRRPIDTRNTYVVSLESRPRDSADSVSSEPYFSQVVNVKVQEMQHYSDRPDSKARRVTPNVEGSAVVLLTSPEKLQRNTWSFTRTGLKSTNQLDGWVREHDKSWKEQQQRKLDTKPTRTEREHR